MPTADLIIQNATIWTGNPQQPRVEALAVSGDSLVAIGSSSEIERYRSDETTVIDASGKMVVPGFIDSHVHFLTGGFRLSEVQLRDAATPEEFIRRIREFAQTVEPGTWITGGDWDHQNWGGELPTRTWIDSVTQDHPVFVTRLDGHMSLANSAALKAASVTKNVAEVEGGEIVRDADGTLTGILKDNAAGLIFPHIPDPTDQQKDRALQAAMQYVASKGVTSIQNMGDGLGEMEVFARARDKGTLITRIFTDMPLPRWPELAEKVAKEGRGDEWYRIGGLKAFVDGSLGSHTAAFFEPFTDSPTDSGLLVNEEEDLHRWISSADSAGLQVMVHAIGDRANHVLLNIFEKVIQENGEKDRRFRIEHAQHLAPADIPRFSQLGVIASMQPYHCIDDGRWAEEVIGSERAKTTYAFRSLLDAGATVAFGSDWFVAPPTPLEGIYAAVTRQTLDGEHPEGWIPEQKISVEEALRAYTANAAFATFEDDIKGTLEVGKLADLVILEQDLTNIPPETIRDVAVEMTVVGGKVVYQR